MVQIDQTSRLTSCLPSLKQPDPIEIETRVYFYNCFYNCFYQLGSPSQQRTVVLGEAVVFPAGLAA
jgi:hypothetical protein